MLPVHREAIEGDRRFLNRRLLVTGAIATGIYPVAATLLVVGSRLSGEPFWAPAVVYFGPCIYFIAIAA